MDKKFEILVEDIEKASLEDATALLMSMLGGPVVMDDTMRDTEKIAKFGASLHRLSKIGMMVVLNKQDIIGMLREHGSAPDDTMLEDDAIISTH